MRASLIIWALAWVGCYSGNEVPLEVGFYECDVAGGCGSRMRPGQNCLRCHQDNPTAPGAVQGPTWTAAGTIFANADSKSTDGVGRVHVKMTDADGRIVEVMSNSSGNFFTAEALTFPLREVLLEREGRTVSMPIDPTHPDTPAFPPTGTTTRAFYAPQGSCNACHADPPIAGAPGRIYAP